MPPFGFAGELLTRLKNVRNLNWDIVKKGPQLSGMKKLQAGDILLKQGAWDNLMTTSVSIGQVARHRSDHNYVGASLLGHAVIYLENGDIAEAVGKGVLLGKLKGHNPAANLNYSDFNFYCLRCGDPRIAAEIAAVARSLVNKADYSKGGLAIAATGVDITPITGDPTDVTTEKLVKGRRPAMFCSEFVVYCCNVATDRVLGKRKRYFKHKQNLVSPEELYVELRDHASWSYLGELAKNRR